VQKAFIIGGNLGIKLILGGYYASAASVLLHLLYHAIRPFVRVGWTDNDIGSANPRKLGIREAANPHSRTNYVEKFR
jgi:hypothetical protein